VIPDTGVDDSLEYQVAIDLPGANASPRSRPVTPSQAIPRLSEAPPPQSEAAPPEANLGHLCDVEPENVEGKPFGD
jgi:hypothetical protein